MSKTLLQILTDEDIDGWDKPGGSDKNSMHSYVDAYEKILSPYQDKECRLLEIGVWHGGSSLLWQEYLQKAKLFCVDIDALMEHTIWLRMDGRRHKFFQLNAYTLDCVERMQIQSPDGFDIIIEDGIHTKQSNEFALTHYLPMLKEGGVMVLEDVPVNTQVEIPFGFSKRPEDVIGEMIALVPDRYKVEVIDLTHVKGRYDDILFVIKN